MPAHHAILIGIDAYKEKPLRGAVNDIQSFKAYFDNLPVPISICAFTATSNPNPASPGLLEDPSLWPTVENIQRAISTTTESAESGDFVYIHYSGHGVREERGSRTYNKSTGDLALALLSAQDPRTVSYLFGRSLAFSINGMVRKGLIVTIVLDCCFSASVFRIGEPGTRSLTYDDAIAIQSPQTASIRQDTFGSAGDRDVSAMPNWLIHPDKYAVLVACGPHEETSEIQVNAQIHGTLSFSLLQILEADGSLRDTHEIIYERLRAEYQRRRYDYHPVFYGDRGRGFFGNPRSRFNSSAIMVVRNARGILELQAGYAHGVTDGDKFTLEAVGVSGSQSSGSLAVGRVDRAGAFTSTLVPLMMSKMPTTTSWRAVPLTQHSLRGFPIRLSTDLPYQQEWLSALEDGHLEVHSEIENRMFSFALALNERMEYVILDAAGNEIKRLPNLPVDGITLEQIRRLLEHLARYRLARELKNTSIPTAFQQSFNISLAGDTGYLRPGSSIEVSHGTTLQLVIENKGSKAIYITIFDLGPHWQVDNVFRSTYEVVLPKDEELGFTGCFEVDLEKIVPDNMIQEDHGTCDDVLKIFIASHPTSFAFLELPELGDLNTIEPSERGDEDTEDVEDWTTAEFSIRVVR